MPLIPAFGRLALALILAGAGVPATGAAVPEPEPAAATKHTARTTPDLSGRKRHGKASIYAKKLAGKKMADGSAMNPQGDNAASKTLPLGTTARVTHLETGKSAVVTIRDRGPHLAGRIVDLSPATAKSIGFVRGVAPVEVAPITVPQPDGSIRAFE